ncbi:MAG: membrane protein insertion efficiency factor YidD [Arenicella sp.]
MEKSFKKVIQLPILIAIYAYRLLISPWLVSSCRYQPTCSEYAQTAFQRHGLFKGGYLTLIRLLKCHPWGGSGYNPVPEVSAKAQCCDSQTKQAKSKTKPLVNFEGK